jgi:hypothetical protein
MNSNEPFNIIFRFLILALAIILACEGCAGIGHLKKEELYRNDRMIEYISKMDHKAAADVVAGTIRAGIRGYFSTTCIASVIVGDSVNFQGCPEKGNIDVSSNLKTISIKGEYNKPIKSESSSPLTQGIYRKYSITTWYKNQTFNQEISLLDIDLAYHFTDQQFGSKRIVLCSENNFGLEFRDYFTDDSVDRFFAAVSVLSPKAILKKYNYKPYPGPCSILGKTGKDTSVPSEHGTPIMIYY